MECRHENIQKCIICSVNTICTENQKAVTQDTALKKVYCMSMEKNKHRFVITIKRNYLLESFIVKLRFRSIQGPCKVHF